MSGTDLILHATCVAVAGEGVLIIGRSGSGKSALALELIALGAALVADDRTSLSIQNGAVVASCPPSICGLIEARGVGLIALKHTSNVKITLIVDVSVVESARLPEKHTHSVLDIALPCLHKVEAPYFPAAIHAYIRGTLYEA